MALQRGEASFTTDAGATYHLVLDIYCFAEAEDVTGLDPNALIKAITPVLDDKGKVIKRPPLKVLGGLLFGALKTRHPEITHADAIRLLGEGEKVGEALAMALERAQPKATESAEGKVPAQAGTGTKRKKTGPRKA